jgi:lipopolysaccharide transport system ATP-binding protein
MSNIAIQSHQLGKQFIIGKREPQRGLHQLFEDATRTVVRGLTRRGSDSLDDSSNILWALRDIEFQIGHGEIVGLIGPNGAGKSVLLKILSRITWPSEGYATIQGRLGSMLEVGAGFHPEFTGRENLYLVGSTLGMNTSRIKNIFDEIVDFSGIEEMLDTPVKRYSSGMYVRLAFAVAANMEANIMLFDEVIAVGDVDFRQRCLDRIRAMSAEGRTVVVVSHNMQTLEDLCPRTIMLEHGRIRHDGDTREILQKMAQS